MQPSIKSIYAIGYAAGYAGAPLDSNPAHGLIHKYLWLTGWEKGITLRLREWLASKAAV